jgi:restriction system protein
MARRDESILNLLVECPWWVSVLVSGIAFVVLRFVLPSIDFRGMAANSFAKGLSSAAPLVAIVLLLPAPIAALNSWLKRRCPDRGRMGSRTHRR